MISLKLMYILLVLERKIESTNYDITEFFFVCIHKYIYTHKLKHIRYIKEPVCSILVLAPISKKNRQLTWPSSHSPPADLSYKSNIHYIYTFTYTYFHKDKLDGGYRLKLYKVRNNKNINHHSINRRTSSKNFASRVEK